MEVGRAALRTVRYGLQVWFLLFSLWIGYRFVLFVRHFETAGSSFVERPSSIDAFLPIAGLMSFRHTLSTFSVEPFHPAAFWLFAAALTASLVSKKGFCGWICPVGTISQYLWMIGETMFGRNARLPKLADTALRSIKYLLMSFFLYIILVRMSSEAMADFFQSDYFKIADVKTMSFFTEMSSTTACFLLVIVAASLIYKNVWCRYLCPYGALLGLTSIFSPLKIRRDEASCVHCSACTRHCPASIDVERSATVSSPECFGCLTCVSRCPAKGALDLGIGALRKGRPLPPLLGPILLLLVFYIIVGMAMASDTWRSQIPYADYQRLLSSGITTLEHP